MRSLVRLLSFALLLALPLAVSAHQPSKAVQLTEERLRTDMRKLWEDHVTYTAFFYTAAINGGDDAGALAARLLRNQDDIGAAVKPFYGDKAGTALAGLLRDHILIAADLVMAAKAGDAAAQKDASAKWLANADDVAGFLASANPFWPRERLQEMLRGHLSMTTDAVVAKLHGDTAGAIAAYDKGHEHMLMVADALTDGLVKQFPGSFRR